MRGYLSSSEDEKLLLGITLRDIVCQLVCQCGVVSRSPLSVSHVCVKPYTLASCTLLIKPNVDAVAVFTSHFLRPDMNPLPKASENSLKSFLGTITIPHLTRRTLPRSVTP